MEDGEVECEVSVSVKIFVCCLVKVGGDDRAVTVKETPQIGGDQVIIVYCFMECGCFIR